MPNKTMTLEQAMNIDSLIKDYNEKLAIHAQQCCTEYDLDIHEVGTEPVCDAALCKVNMCTIESQDYQLVERFSNDPSDYGMVKRAVRDDTTALEWLAAHSDLYEEPEERKPLINKQGLFSRTPAKDNERIGLVRTTTVKHSTTKGPKWAKLDGLTTWPKMGSCPRAFVQGLANALRNNTVYGNLYDFLAWLDIPNVHDSMPLSSKEKSLLWDSYKIGRACWAAKQIVHFFNYVTMPVDSKLLSWENKVIAAMHDGRIGDGKWLYTHIADIQGRCPTDKMAQFKSAVSHIWQEWKTRKACFAIASFLNNI